MEDRLQVKKPQHDHSNTVKIEKHVRSTDG